MCPYIWYIMPACISADIRFTCLHMWNYAFNNSFYNKNWFILKALLVWTYIYACWYMDNLQLHCNPAVFQPWNFYIIYRILLLLFISNRSNWFSSYLWQYQEWSLYVYSILVWNTLNRCYIYNAAYGIDNCIQCPLDCSYWDTLYYIGSHNNLN